MPEVDGIEVLRQLSELPKTPKLLLVSGFDPTLLDRAESLAKAWRMEVIATMTKPLDIVELRGALAAM